jgi:glycosyltransferase involved in cell wall biosynthesis
MLHLAKWAREHTGEDKLGLAGGVALNAKANMVIHYAKIFNDIFIFPAANDAGGPIGAAAWVYEHALGGKMKRQRLRTVYLGPEYSDEEVKKVVERGGWDAKYVGDDVNPVVDLVVKGHVVTWYQGRAELGPRALGNRSIIADPRKKDMWSIVNKIKGREWWRPLAPSLLEEDVGKYFIDPVPHQFMILMFKYRNDMCDLEVRLIVNCKSMVIQLDMPYNDVKEISTESMLNMRPLEPLLLRDLINMFMIIIKLLVNKYDIIIEYYNYSVLSLLFKLINKPLIYDAHCVEYELAKSSLSKMIILLNESLLAQLSDNIVALSNYDALIFAKTYKIPLNKIKVIKWLMVNKNNNITIKNIYKEMLALKRGSDILVKPLIIFHGNLRYGPNADAVNFIMSNLAPNLKDAIFIVVGPNPPFIGRRDNIIFTGFVSSEELERYLLASDIAIAPLRIVTGINMKMHDYISFELPIVTTKVTLRWLDVNNVRGTLIITSLDKFVDVLNQVIKSKNYKGTAWIHEHKLTDIARDYIEVFSSLAIKFK